MHGDDFFKLYVTDEKFITGLSTIEMRDCFSIN